MTTDELEKLIKKLLAKGVTVIVLMAGPAGQITGSAPGDEPRATQPPATTAPATPSTADPQRAAPTGDPQATTRAPRAPGHRAPGVRVPTVLPDGTWSQGTVGSAPDLGDDDGGSGTGDGTSGTGDRTGQGSTAGGTGSGAGSGNGTTSDPGTGDGMSTAGQGVTAAEKLGWGDPVRSDDFTGGTDGWNIYDGPGHAGNGRRTPDAVSTGNGMLTITGGRDGDTAGMAWMPGQKYGRWEGRVRAPASDPSYNALLLLWPDAENFPEGGEVDFMEMMDHTRQKTNVFLHYGADNSQVSGDVEIDATEWHNWAVEWTPKGITAYVDGERWWETTDTSILPPGPMHLCIQLDWFPKGGDVKESTMQVDWVKQYTLDGGATGGSAGGGD